MNFKRYYSVLREYVGKNFQKVIDVKKCTMIERNKNRLYFHFTTQPNIFGDTNPVIVTLDTVEDAVEEFKEIKAELERTN